MRGTDFEFDGSVIHGPVLNPRNPTQHRQCDDKHSHNNYPLDRTIVLIRIELSAFARSNLAETRS